MSERDPTPTAKEALVVSPVDTPLGAHALPVARPGPGEVLVKLAGAHLNRLTCRCYTVSTPGRGPSLSFLASTMQAIGSSVPWGAV